MIESLKDLIVKYGKDKINTLTKYPSILTLHKIGEKGRLLDEFTTKISIYTDPVYATEKIDGTNARIILLGDKFIIGSREFLLYYKGDMFYDLAQGIVEGINSLKINMGSTYFDKLTVIYGEFYGGKASAASKNYGQDKVGFRVFDVAEYDDLSILEKSREEISYWREHETEFGLVYGQNFLSRIDIERRFPELEMVPIIEFRPVGISHQAILDELKLRLPKTTVALSEAAQMQPEGLVLRTGNRSRIVKIRYEDYERTLKPRK